MSNYNFIDMNMNELLDLYNNLSNEINARNNEYRNKLIQKVCNAINELLTEFPDTRLIAEIYPEEYKMINGGIDFDVLEYFTDSGTTKMRVEYFD